jgi:hypothetical protein
MQHPEPTKAYQPRVTGHVFTNVSVSTRPEPNSGVTAEGARGSLRVVKISGDQQICAREIRRIQGGGDRLRRLEILRVRKRSSSVNTVSDLMIPNGTHLREKRNAAVKWCSQDDRVSGKEMTRDAPRYVGIT